MSPSKFSESVLPLSIVHSLPQTAATNIETYEPLCTPCGTAPHCSLVAFVTAGLCWTAVIQQQPCSAVSFPAPTTQTMVHMHSPSTCSRWLLCFCTRSTVRTHPPSNDRCIVSSAVRWEHEIRCDRPAVYEGDGKAVIAVHLGTNVADIASHTLQSIVQRPRRTRYCCARNVAVTIVS